MKTKTKNPRAEIAAFLLARKWCVVSQDRRSTEFATMRNRWDRLIQILPNGAWAILDLLYNDVASGKTALGFKRAYGKEFKS